MPRAILFDLDETLTDRGQSILRYAKRFRRDFSDEQTSAQLSTVAEALRSANIRGYKPRDEILKDLSQRLSWRAAPDVSRLGAHWDRWFPLSVAPQADLEETLTMLHEHGIRLGIVTNGEVLFQKPKITQLSIERYCATVIISEAVHVQKPDPRIFAHALAEIGCDASDARFVGDDPVNDILGAAAAGLRPIWLTGVKPWPAEHPMPQWQIAALSELVTMVERADRASDELAQRSGVLNDSVCLMDEVRPESQRSPGG